MMGTLEDETHRWQRELAKGSSRLTLLALLEDGESYGYQILATLRERSGGLLNPREAAVYPMLKDLENRGFLKSRWKATDEGVPPRKYYALTAEGAALYSSLKSAWRDFTKGIDRIIGA